MTDKLKEIDPEYPLSKGKWEIVYQDLAVPRIFEKRKFLLTRSKKVKEFYVEGFTIVSIMKIQ